MTYYDQLCLVASVLVSTHPDYATTLENIALGVRRLERFVDEQAADAMEDEQLRCQGGNVVRLDRFRRIPIQGGAA